MFWITSTVFSVVVAGSWSAEELSFPPGFKFGVGSSSYQIEGAWNVSGNAESIWDHYTHRQPSPVADQSNGDVACDSFRLWRRDVEMLDELGVNFYRFSISWTRILPNGFTSHISQDGVKYYNDLIDALLEKGIEPFVSIYHWELPQHLQNLGGWTNPLISTWFADFARLVYSLYGDRVKSWVTINEPIVMCDTAYRFNFMAPGITSDEGAGLCNKHVLLAHAKAWRIYDKEFRAKYHGRVSLTIVGWWFKPVTEDDRHVAEVAEQFFVGVYAHPVFSAAGGWPPAVEKVMNEHQRFYLPALSKEETDLIRGTYDFYAVNYYTGRMIRRAHETEQLGPWPIGDAPQLGARLEVDPTWKLTATSFYPQYPEGLRNQLSWIKREYGDVPIVITENGFSTRGHQLNDADRIHFFRVHLEQVLLSIKEDGVNVTAFSVWSLMDSFEWMDGYNTKFGLYSVDFSSADRVRSPRASALYYSSIIRSRSLNVTEDVMVAENTSISDQTSSAPIYIIGAVFAVAILFTVLLVRNIRRRRTSAVQRNTYIGVQVDDK